MSLPIPRRSRNDDYAVQLAAYVLGEVEHRMRPQLAELRSDYRTLGELLVKLEAQHEAVADRISVLAADRERSDGDLANLSRDHDELDARFTKVLAAQAERSVGGGNGRHVEHQQIAEKYRTFVDQELTSAARAANTSARKRFRSGDGRELRAETLAVLSRALFADQEIDEQALAEVLKDQLEWAMRLAILGTELRTQAAASAPVGAWNFDFEPHAPLDPQTQRPWGDHAADDPVGFVVAPSYVVEDRVFETQLVTTERHTKH